MNESLSGARGAFPILLSTGTADWHVPSDYYESVLKEFGYLDENGLCACSSVGESDYIRLTFSDKIEIQFNAKDIMPPLYNSSTNMPVYYHDSLDFACRLAMTPVEGHYGAFGYTWLGSMYTVFDLDNGQVSIAQADRNSSGKQPEEVVPVAAGPKKIDVAAPNVKGAEANSYLVAPMSSATVEYALRTSTSANDGSEETSTARPKDSAAGAKSHVGVIAGAVVGGLAGLALSIGGILFFLLRRKRRQLRSELPEMQRYAVEPKQS